MHLSKSFNDILNQFSDELHYLQKFMRGIDKVFLNYPSITYDNFAEGFVQ